MSGPYSIKMIKRGLDTVFSSVIGPTPPSGFDSVFGNNTFAQIQTAANEIAYFGYSSADVESKYGWKIGDTIRYVLSTGEKIEMRLADVNHDDLYDGTGKAGITLEMTHCLASTYYMYGTASNSGGYASSTMYKSIMKNLKQQLPQELQDAIVPVGKISSSGGTTSNYVKSSCDLFLLSEVEIMGSKASKAQNASKEGTQYSYYATHTTANDRKKSDYVGGTSNVRWWLRSCAKSNSKNYCYMADWGSVDTLSATSSCYASFALCIGRSNDYVEPETVFSKSSWADIIAIANEISAKGLTSAQVETQYGWKIGDTKDIILTDGSVDKARLIGVNHDDLATGGKAGITLDVVRFSMTDSFYPQNYSVSWDLTDMRNDTLPTIKNMLPDEIRNNIKQVNKICKNGGGANYTADIVVVDDLFVLSFDELGVTQDNIEGSTYEYYLNNSSEANRIKFLTDTPHDYWTRTPSSESAFGLVSETGAKSNGLGYYTHGVSYALCL